MQLKMKSTQLGGIANLALLAEVKSGFVPGAETFTYAERLEALLKTLNAIRLASRESTLSRSPFPDALGRWGILHAFRYALIPPDIGDRGKAEEADDTLTVGTYRLYLSVTFDGGWEPYIRVIYRDLGSLLDTIFTNCVGYPLSRECSFDTYTRWVRSREVPAGIFYTESAMSVMDERYLAEVERIQRQDPDPARARRSIASLSVKPPPQVDVVLAEFQQADPQTQYETLYNSFRALKALHDLRAYYPDSAGDAGDVDRRTLHLFAVAALPEFGAFLKMKVKDPKFQSDPKVQSAQAQIKWLLGDADKAKPMSAVRRPLEMPNQDAQLGILTAFQGVTHGVLFLLAVTDADKAGEYLRSLKLTTDAQDPLAGQIYCNVAFTRQGLEAMRAPKECLDWLPQEFIEGMEARAGMLGDVRGNHPEHWRRPVYQDREVDLASVHVVLQFRLAATSDELLHPELARLGEHLAKGGAGVRLLSTEPMRSTLDSEGRSIEHFGFKDGFSQPVNSDQPVGAKWNNAVNLGELLLGYPNDRGDPPYPPQVNPYLDNGSFLVVRKIRQDVGKWRQMLRDAARTLDPNLEHRNPAEQAAAAGVVAAKMVGRDMEGNAIVDPQVGGSNDFNYEGDSLGMRCPFQSHVRRANPRRLQVKTPRLVRRGMSYGPRFDAKPEAERGLYFMAYCGSIAEQFEVVQRWIAGGNSTGVLAAHSDPMLGVPQKGVERTFQWLGQDTQAARVSLGDEALTQLEWGLYLFAPSKSALVKLSSPPPRLRATPSPERDMRHEVYDPVGKAFEERKALLQDRENRDRIWKRVNEAGGQVQTAYGLLVSEPSAALKILRDDGTKYSVCGYGRRFSESIGLGFLGQDPQAGHTRLAEDSGIKMRIAEIDEQIAFNAARAVTFALLAKYAPGDAGSRQETFVDILDLNERALAKLCTDWFGFPDESSMHTGTSAEPFTNQATDPPCCPRDFVHVARHIFGPHPTKPERERGIERGQAIHKAVLASVERYRAGKQELVGLSKQIADALSKEPPSVIAQTIAGVILGFAPSVHGNFTNVMRAWVEHSTPDTPSLWDLQTRYFDPGRGDRESYEATVAVLRHDLIKQMRRELVPPAIWREPVGAPIPSGATKETIGATPATEPEKIIVGLHGIMQHDSAGEFMMFGGAIKGDPAAPEELKTDHACPGRGMAIGVLLGVISTLLLAGTLRSTPSYTLIKAVR